MRGKRLLSTHIFTFVLLMVVFSEKVPGVLRAAQQYGIASRIVDLATFDITNNPWRCGDLFDAIVTDPPCMSVSLINSKFMELIGTSQMVCVQAQKD